MCRRQQVKENPDIFIKLRAQMKGRGSAPRKEKRKRQKTANEKIKHTN